MKVDVVGFTPEQMNFDVLRRLPEERICSVLGVPPVLAHLGAGLERATYSNVDGLRDFFAESKLSPTWKLFGSQLTAQLLPDFGPSPMQGLGFDTSNVRALQDDQNEIWARAGNAVAQGWVMVSEAKRAVGLPTVDTDDVYLRPLNLVEVPSGELSSGMAREVSRALEASTD